jgi:dipeptidyl aminopeptidase/acylaminoacyl peptidase
MFQFDAVFSPDGRWLAYVSSGFGTERQIFVQSYPDLTSKYQITAEDSHEPLWSPDGKQLVYVRGSTLNVVDIRKEPAFSAGTPVAIPIAKAFQDLVRTRTYDITPDGRRFLVVVPSVQGEATPRPTSQITVVLNWGEELKARVPTR